jgi:hypothetical protein
MMSRKASQAQPSPGPEWMDAAFADFEAEHPEVAEALRVFDLSFAWYSAAVMATEGPRASVSDSTERVQNAYMD